MKVPAAIPMNTPDRISDVFERIHPMMIPRGVETAKIITIAIACFFSTSPLLKLIPKVKAAAHLWNKVAISKLIT